MNRAESRRLIFSADFCKTKQKKKKKHLKLPLDAEMESELLIDSVITRECNQNKSIMSERKKN